MLFVISKLICINCKSILNKKVQKKYWPYLFGGPIYFLHFLYDTGPLGEVVIREVENAFVKKNFFSNLFKSTTNHSCVSIFDLFGLQFVIQVTFTLALHMIIS